MTRPSAEARYDPVWRADATAPALRIPPARRVGVGVTNGQHRQPPGSLTALDQIKWPSMRSGRTIAKAFVAFTRRRLKVPLRE